MPNSNMYIDAALHRAGQNAIDLQGLNLFDQNTLAQLQKMLAPLFAQQQGNMTQQFTDTRNAMSSQAGQNAGAVAAFRGYNPSSFAQNATERTNKSLAPSYFQAQGGLQASQLENLFNSVGQSGQFRANNLQGAAGIHLGSANLLEGQRQFNVEQENQPGFWDYLASGIFSGLGQFAGGFGRGLGSRAGLPDGSYQGDSGTPYEPEPEYG